MKVHRITIYNSRGELINDRRPHVSDGRIMIPEYPKALVLVDTSRLIVCNYLEDDRPTTYHFFISGPVKMSWGELNDDIRMIFRTETGFRHGEFEYEDNRYYTLEALCD